MKISVLIPTHNRSKLLQQTLQGLCDQTESERIEEIIVIEDGSTDDTPNIVATFADRLPIRHISQPKSGVSVARNLGIREARGKLTLLLDDDVIPSPSLVREHTDFHWQFSDKEVVLMGYVTWLPEANVTPFMNWYGEQGALFGFGLLKHASKAHPRYLYTPNISFKTSFLQESGGFDESLTVHEDYELGYRLAKVGMTMYFSRSALGFHNQHFTFQEACDRMNRYRKGMKAFLMTDAGLDFSFARFGVMRFIKRIATHRPIQVPLVICRLLDSRYELPGLVYRLFYWYFAILVDNDSCL